jgi:hypothetical protein
VPRKKLAYNERIKWITSFCNNLASASVVLGMLTPFLTNAVPYWLSVPISIVFAAAFGGFSMWLLGDLLEGEAS